MTSSKIDDYKDSGIYILFRIKEMCKCQSKKLEESKVFVSEKEEQGEENQCVLLRAEISVERAESQLINEQKI